MPCRLKNQKPNFDSLQLGEVHMHESFWELQIDPHQTKEENSCGFTLRFSVFEEPQIHMVWWKWLYSFLHLQIDNKPWHIYSAQLLFFSRAFMGLEVYSRSRFSWQHCPKIIQGKPQPFSWQHFAQDYPGKTAAVFLDSTAPRLSK